MRKTPGVHIHHPPPPSSRAFAERREAAGNARCAGSSLSFFTYLYGETCVRVRAEGGREGGRGREEVQDYSYRVPSFTIYCRIKRDFPWILLLAVRTDPHIIMCICICICKCTCICICACTCKCMCICTCICNIHIYIPAYIYVLTHTHIHTYRYTARNAASRP